VLLRTRTYLGLRRVTQDARNKSCFLTEINISGCCVLFRGNVVKVSSIVVFINTLAVSQSCCHGYRWCVLVIFVMGRGRGHFVVSSCRVDVVVGSHLYILTRIACISNSTSPHIYIAYIRTHPCLESAWCCFSCLRVFVFSRALGYAWCCFRSCIYFLVRCFYFAILFCCMYVCLLYTFMPLNTLPFSSSN